MLKINTTSKYAELKFEDKSDLYPLNEISYTVENESETVSFYNRFYKKIVTEQISNIQVNDVPVTRDNIQSLLSVLFAGYESSGGGDVDLSNYYTKPETNTLLDNKVDKVSGKGLSTEDYTTAEKSKLAGLENYDDDAVKGSIAANTAAINAEVTRAKAAEKVNGDAITAVDSAYKAADTTLQGNIDAEVTRATTAEGELNTKIDTKVAKVAGKQLSTEDYTTAEKEKLASLANYDDTTVKSSVSANTAAIEAEVIRAKAAEKVNADAITALDTAYKAADTVLKGNTDTEVTRATAAEGVLNTKIDTKVDKVSGKGLSTEDYTTADKTKLSGLENYDDTTVKGSITANTTAIEAEVTRAKAAKKVNADAISVIEVDYKAADTILQGNIEAEVTRAKAAEQALDTKVDTKADKDVLFAVSLDENTLQLTDKRIQHTVITNNTSVVFPTVDEYTEIHLIFDAVTGYTISFPADVAWKETPTEMMENEVYEFIFTYLNNMNKWIAGFIKYE